MNAELIGGLSSALAGAAAGFGLIMAIGAQNAFVIRQGLSKQHVLLVVLICALSDTALIVAGVAGLGAVIQALPWLLLVFKIFGAGYLAWFGFKSIRAAKKGEYLELTQGQPTQSALKIAASCLMFTWLNPHVYLDTVIFLGGLANQFQDHRWAFAVGASMASWIWFSGLGFGAKAASKWMAKPSFWKALDTGIGVLMFVLAGVLLLQ
jgi:L-lysine exporter family protein LysE/ArgO